MVMFNNTHIDCHYKTKINQINQLVVFSLAVFLWLLPTIGWANIQAFLNQDNAYIDDPITLTIEINANTNDNPDLSPLKKDFTIISTSNRSHISLVNGNRSAKKSWVIQLQPLRKGKLTIPAITLGNEKTQPLTLTISDVPADITKETKQHVFVEAAVSLKDGKSPYIQQQISYTAKLFYDEQLIRYEMYPPNIENAVIEQLQQKDKYQVTRDGKTYTVIERNYVISAEKSGELTIPPVIMKGNIRNKKPNRGQQRQYNDPFLNDPFGSNFFSGSLFGEQGKAITLRSKALKVDVQSLPTAFKGDNWLPAEAVQLSDSWQKNLPTFRVGEPVSRTLNIQAKGLASSQIPKLELIPIEAIRAYPDQEQNENYTDGNTVIGERSQTISYIPNQAGQVTLPEITLDWWNVVTKQQQTASLPAITITIAAGAGSTQNEVTTSSTTPPPIQENNNSDTNDTDTPTMETPTASKLLSLLITLGVLMLLAGIGFVIFKNKTTLLNQYQQLLAKRKRPIHGLISSSQKQLKQQLQQACEQNNPQQAAHYLLALTQQQWPNHAPQSIGALAEQLATGANVVRQLDQSLYAENDNAWTGTALWDLVSNGLQRKRTSTVPAADGLNALYPTR